MIRIRRLIFPSLSLLAIALSIATYWSVKNYITGIENLNELNTSRGKKNIDYDELVRIYEKENQLLRERTLKVSPSGKRSAYFKQRLIIDSEDKWDQDHTSVIIESEDTKETVFQGDERLSFLEWLNDDEIVVYRGCGTECMQAYIVDLKTKIPRDISIGVGYSWSPDKNYVLAYHYSWKYGISVANKGDEFGRTIFQVTRDQPPNGSGLTNKTQAIWSPNSAKLALIIRKEKEEKLEVVVFDIISNFKPLLHKDLASNEFSDFHWEDSKTLSYFVNGKIISEKI